MNLKSRRHHREHARLAIDESIRVYDKLLLILSEHSVASDCVEHEIEMVLAREQEQKRIMLFPIRPSRRI